MLPVGSTILCAGTVTYVRMLVHTGAATVHAAEEGGPEDWSCESVEYRRLGLISACVYHSRWQGNC